MPAAAEPLCRWTTLPNGLGVVVQPMPQSQSAAVGIWVRAGGRYEAARLAGVSHFIEHLVFKGTRTRSCEALKRSIEGVGGLLNAFTAEEFTCYLAKVPGNHARRAVDVLSDMVLHPAFRPRDIEREREVILEEIRMYEDTPAQYVHELFNQLLWPNHPLGHLLAGSARTMRRMDRADVVAYWRRFYHPKNILVAGAGALDAAAVGRQLRRAFRGVRRGTRQPMPPAPRMHRGPQVRLVNKTTEQTHVCVGTPALSRTHRLRFAMELVHVLLGANMSSRLFHEVREKRGLVYEIGTHIKRYQDTGAFVIYAGCDAAKLPRTMQTVMAELHRLKRERVRPAELRRAKEFYTGQLSMGLEDTVDHMCWIGEQAITVGRVGRPEDVVSAIERVTATQVQHVARVLFQTSRMHLAAIGPIPPQQAGALRALCTP